ncbi:unnamed protein product [Caenorhabditis auriculariae]|uniref:Myb-like domain-containing protein n=1 Tax=Caenorhabditis auriculariae TaxID=2777116 RepID=A0A8S1HK33_9PELO|nr:unnamed protein product [Caenorhabditis auriculariae]
MRRNRIQIKPNISKGGRTIVPAAAAVETTPAEAPLEPVPSTAGASNSRPEEIADTVDNGGETTSIRESDECQSRKVIIGDDDEEVSENLGHDVQKVVVEDAANCRQFEGVDPLAPQRRIAHVPNQTLVLRRERYHSGDSDFYNLSRPERKKFTGEEQLNTKTMRMMDLIHWNPKGEQKLKKRERADSTLSSVALDQKDEKPATITAPQVKIGVDGRFIIDEASLVIAANAGNSTIWETVEEGRNASNVSSMSFRTRLWRKGTAWTEKETDLFYEILQCTGPDFGLIHEFFPSRARNELKSKFNREEKFHWDRLQATLSKPVRFDESIHTRVAVLTDEIEKELEEKRNRAKNSRKNVNKVEAPDWDENNVDLVAEAERIINELEVKSVSAEKRKRKSDKERNTKMLDPAKPKMKRKHKPGGFAWDVPIEPRQTIPRSTVNKSPKYKGFDENESSDEEDQVEYQKPARAVELKETANAAMAAGGHLFHFSPGPIKNS